MIVSAISNIGKFLGVNFLALFISPEVCQPSGSRGPGVRVVRGGDPLHHGGGDLGGDRPADHYHGQLLLLGTGEK